MPGMNRNSRSIRLIEAALQQVESDGATAGDALLALDEIRRLERKWNEQVAANSPRRIESDFKTMAGWYRLWLLAAKRINARGNEAKLLAAMAEVEQSVRQT